MPDSNDRPFRPNERVAETLAKADQKRMQETMRRRPSIGAPLYQTTVGRRNPTDGLYPSMSREEEWRLVRQVSSQLTPEGQRAVKEEMARSNREFFEEHYKAEATTVKEEQPKSKAALPGTTPEQMAKIEASLSQTNLHTEIIGKSVQPPADKIRGTDPPTMDKTPEIGQTLQKSGITLDPDKG